MRGRERLKNILRWEWASQRIANTFWLFTYFLDLILIQFWRPKWKVNSVSEKAGYQLVNTQSALGKRSNFNWFFVIVKNNKKEKITTTTKKTWAKMDGDPANGECKPNQYLKLFKVKIFDLTSKIVPQNKDIHTISNYTFDTKSNKAKRKNARKNKHFVFGWRFGNVNALRR